RVDHPHVPRAGSGARCDRTLVGGEMTGWILGAAEAADAVEAGGKARALGRATRAGLPVPPWFVLSSAAFTDSLTLAPGAGEALDLAVRGLSPRGELLAVRSSAVDEDGPHQSIAGQLESFLNVPPCDVRRRTSDVCRSAFTDRHLAYRREHGLAGFPRPPAVLIQRM